MYTVPNSQAVDDCRFCAIADGRHAFAYDVPIMAERDYFAVASIGGFISGWSLVCPREHHHNLALEYCNPSFHAAVSPVVSAVTAEFGDAAIFEHGSVRDGSLTACGTCHAHLHVVPFAGELADIAVKAESGLSWSSVQIQDLAAASAGSEYLFVANRYNGAKTVGYFAHLPTPRSQFFRQLLARQLKVPHLADYRTAPLEDASSATTERARAAFQRLFRHAA
jgi:diadenosine tetraphosphate (Ap4A) HIT family hydrolase